MPGTDKIALTVLEDGTAKLEVEGISGANHARADALVKEFARLMGGPLEIDASRKHAHGHRHEHEHAHDHEEAGH